jgi:hypothetical protein
MVISLHLFVDSLRLRVKAACESAIRKDSIEARSFFQFSGSKSAVGKRYNEYMYSPRR